MKIKGGFAHRLGVAYTWIVSPILPMPARLPAIEAIVTDTLRGVFNLCSEEIAVIPLIGREPFRTTVGAWGVASSVEIGPYTFLNITCLDRTKNTLCLQPLRSPVKRICFGLLVYWSPSGLKPPSEKPNLPKLNVGDGRMVCG